MDEPVWATAIEPSTNSDNTALKLVFIDAQTEMETAVALTRNAMQGVMVLLFQYTDVITDPSAGVRDEPWLAATPGTTVETRGELEAVRTPTGGLAVRLRIAAERPSNWVVLTEEQVAAFRRTLDAPTMHPRAN
jgi:hypothetical protein